MKLQAGLWQQQTLKLNMTQELSQAITLLQYTSLELNAFLESKALENPLIDIDLPQTSIVDLPQYRRKATSNYDHQDWIEQISVNRETLTDYLYAQLDLKSLSNEEMKVLSTLFEELDENGYLPKEIKIKGLQDWEIEGLINILQGLDPAGVGARTLQECLLLQIDREENVPPHTKEVLLHHFMDFGEKRWKEISKNLNIELTAIQTIADYVKELNPRPGSEFTVDQPPYITPEVLVKVEMDSIFVKLFDGTLTKVKYNEEYRKLFQHKEDPAVKQFLKEKEQDFEWIINSLRHRKETILKVSQAIVEHQQPFFLKGPQYIQPLTLKDLSKEVGVHESTVSRAVKGKYMQTPFGTFELKFFFSSAIKTSLSDLTSSTGVKNEIVQMVKEEDKKKPLSDQKIADILKGKGIVVSRRTVAKYRDQLDIPSSSIRKRYE
ncbi:RNA polymerase sigma-54 factor [Bacillus pakistanensis]|uniref:RNA polymerase sigma-54 factor n=1 Tax=Rossellomorea pakistanensis TaxID=992288 RepID=A0ABS2NDT8_9BACI|nr:RNA polymerase factor sigma-54 [Bacillus pakistanensis]MBM7586011.1 RNA polymerase sigma-54 factor [Bacillus pakistanensis]